MAFTEEVNMATIFTYIQPFLTPCESSGLKSFSQLQYKFLDSAANQHVAALHGETPLFHTVYSVAQPIFSSCFLSNKMCKAVEGLLYANLLFNNKQSFRLHSKQLLQKITTIHLVNIPGSRVKTTLRPKTTIYYIENVYCIEDTNNLCIILDLICNTKL